MRVVRPPELTRCPEGPAWPKAPDGALDGTLPPLRVIKIGIEDLPDDRGRANKERLNKLMADGPIFIKECQEPFTVPISKVRFTHDEAKDRFGDGRPLWDFVNRVGSDIAYLMEVNPLRVVQIGSRLFSLDNRRLAGLALGGVGIVRVRWATREEVVKEFLWRFSTTTEGESVVMPKGKVVTIPKVA